MLLRLLAVPHNVVRPSAVPDASSLLAAGFPALLLLLALVMLGFAFPSVLAAGPEMAAMAASYAFGKVRERQRQDDCECDFRLILHLVQFAQFTQTQDDVLVAIVVAVVMAVSHGGTCLVHHSARTTNSVWVTCAQALLALAGFLVPLGVLAACETQCRDRY